LAVSGTMGITNAVLRAGRSGIEAQRGTDTWGANYVFNASGIQEDLLVIADEFQSLSTSGAYATDAEVAAVSGAITISGGLTNPTITGDLAIVASGTQYIGAAATPLSASGIFMNASDGTVMQLVLYSDGLVSGVAV